MSYSCMKTLTDKASELGDDVYEVCKPILEDERFPVWSGSSQSFQHHYGKGGLISHTEEVVALCFMNKNYFNYDIDEKELFLAAFYHDVGKMWDYEPVKNLTVHKYSDLNDYTCETNYSEWTSAPHKRYIHHISRSAITWASNATLNKDIYEKYHDKVLHAILSHHTCREFGSPVAPKSRVAWLLTLCDNISARMADCETFDVLDR